DILVDLCHAGAFSSEIEATGERRRQLDHFLWEISQSLLPAVQKRYGRKSMPRKAEAEASI
ncbi:MAG: hypothetical protein VKM34_05950, partial [Cyanobacteriota bacterium]|nr:hypothetical protein [Cyanobacteriota bacterium]